MKLNAAKFLRDENGAVTVDWVVLTAAVVALGVMAALVMTTATTGLSDDIWAYMDSLDLFP
jgi:Flp pilus assembly pilin Flp